MREIVDKAVKVDVDLFVVFIKLDKNIPNELGYIVFTDDTKLLTGTYTAEVGAFSKKTNILKLYLDLNNLPFFCKNVEEFLQQLPLTAKVYLRNHK